MRFALDKDGNRVFIENTFVKQDYFCPTCGETLVLKKGKIRAHHFAHPSHSQCVDTWHYDMSDWHMRWQNRFPLDAQEIVKEKDGQKHRADVLIEGKKTVLEFQHSALSAEEFDDRNRFYNSFGYKVVWIFDLSEQYESEAIENYKEYLFKWVRPKKTFDHFIPKENPNVELFFQLQLAAEENEDLAVLKEFIDAGHHQITSEDKRHYAYHKDDKNELVKVTWASPGGFERFAIDGNTYDENDIVKKYSGLTERKETSFKLSDLADSLIYLYSKDHTSYYFGCPRSSTHLCANSCIDIHESRYDEIRPCIECEFSSQDNECNLLCRKRFVELGLPEETRITVLQRTSDGFISRILYDIDGSTKIVDLPTFVNIICKSVFDLWKENGCRAAVFRNSRTQYFVKIIRDPIEQKNKYGKVFGYLSKDQYSFKGDSRELYDCDKPEWICCWSNK